MNWATLQQLIRILLYSGGSMAFGTATADGELFQAAIGGVVSIGAFVWWIISQRKGSV